MTRPNLTAVVACTALCVAVFGSTPIGQAAARLVVPKNAVGTVQLKNRAVTGLKVKDGTLMAADFKPGQLPAGTQGAPGAAGPAGPTGATGPSGISGYETVAQNFSVASGTETVQFAQCPGNKTVIGGGYAAYWPIVVEASHASGKSSWGVMAKNLGVSSVNLAYYAVCANVSK